MLDTVEERVKLLRMGFTGKEIEKAYLIANNIRLVDRNVLYENFNFN